MEEYQAHLETETIVEIGDYIWSETSGIIQGEVFRILTTQQRHKTLIVYNVERPDGEKFIIFDFDVKGLQKSDTWFAKLIELAQNL
jgi:hypothetical protein